MSGIKGGIFGQVTGKTGGIVFSKARGRDGVVNTTRTLTKPANPRTPAQVSQRNKFDESVRLARLAGGAFYSKVFNRAIGQLPGYQSMMNLTLNNREVNGDFAVFPAIRYSNQGGILGLDIQPLGATEIQVYWDPTPPSGGAADDQFDVLIFPADPSLLSASTVQTLSVIRSGGEANFEVPDSTESFICVVMASNAAGTVRQEIQDAKKV